MTCTCGGELYQFEPGPTVRSKPAGLPQICTVCGRVMIEGKEVAFPEGFGEKLAEMAAGAARAAAEARQEVVNEALTTELRIEKYFDKVYRQGYVHGFFRAVAYWKSVVTEGRIVKLRKLGRATRKELAPGSSEYVVKMDGDLYTEFDRLLALGAAPLEDDHGSSPAN